MNDSQATKVPEVTLWFWIIKILATTLGEIGGDAVTMSMDLGYLVGTGIFCVAFVGAAMTQIRAKQFHPWLYWAAIIASTTLGTTLADYADRSLGIGYTGGSSLLLLLLLGSLLLWYRSTGSIAVSSIDNPKSEFFYWLTIMFSQTLGTALGDWVADTRGLGYVGGIIIFGGLLALIAVLYFTRRVSHIVLFWAAFVLTRPLGAVVGDFLDKPVADGGLALSRYTGTLALVVVIALCILIFPQRAARRSH
jgi:uncharacterized membrane-anchored protein